MESGYLGIDVGSVSTNLVVIGSEADVLASVYIRTQGNPIGAIQRGLIMVAEELADRVEIKAVGTTGSARNLAGVVVGADLVKNEITAHAVASIHSVPGVKTIFEIGGQDSKIIILRDGIVTDFAMNTVCAAGTGSFLEHQATRLGIPIEKFGELALAAKNPVRIAGRCTVFAESDMIHKQQLGHSMEDIIAGLCDALVRNYLNNVGKGKEILPPIAFQGGVAANAGMKKAFEKSLNHEVVVPKHFAVMGALGAAIIARETVEQKKKKTMFKGFEVTNFSYKTRSFECKSCPNRCEIVQFFQNGEVIARWGSRCGKWDVQAS